MKYWIRAFLFKTLHYPVEKTNHVLKFFFLKFLEIVQFAEMWLDLETVIQVK